MSDVVNEVFGRRHRVVIANPPYIVPPTAAARALYRTHYVSAAGQYGLGAPFTERMFELAVDGGFIAQITSNAFMKREYGVRLITDVLPHYDLTHVIDTSGAYIPGHGTPTVILGARNAPPSGADVRAVMSRKGEPSTPTTHIGEVWSSILRGLGAPAEHAPSGCNPIGLVWAGRLSKLAKALTVDVAAALKVEKKQAAPVAAAWITGAGALRLFDALRAGYEGRAPTADEHLSESFTRVADELPDGEWWNPDAGVNPCWRHVPSRVWSDRVRAEVAAVVDPWAVPDEQAGSPTGLGGVSRWRTDWVGDLYQGLDELARDEHAFCQTPWFVGKLLAGMSVEPALATFGDGATVIDPACGTGHLLGEVFRRLYLHRADPEDGGPEYTYPACARMALDQVYGADLNPVAAALCRWRLMVAYLGAAAPRHFGLVPDDLPIHVATADALTALREPVKIDHARRWAAAAAPAPVAQLAPRQAANDFGPLFAAIAGGAR